MSERGEQDLSNGGIFIGIMDVQTLKQRFQKIDVNGNVTKPQSCAQACIFLIKSFRLVEVHCALSSLTNQRTRAQIVPLIAYAK